MLEYTREGLLREVERQLAIAARCGKRRDQPRDVPVVERDDRLGIAPQAPQRLAVGEPAHTS
jgi:hypothetical protein